jgi:hypothetical protein
VDSVEQKTKSWAERISAGEVSHCPICGQKLVKNETLLLFECSASRCMWNDALADSAEAGLYVPPQGWRLTA